MREIKFRGWHKAKNKMYQVCGMGYVVNIGAGCVEIDSVQCASYEGGEWSNEGEYSAEKVDLMQYTGIKDKNGVEIYEGDIVRLIDLAQGDMGRYVVDFNYDSAGFFMCFKQEIKHFIDHYPEDEVEVIGNIYENPELLEK